MPTVTTLTDIPFNKLVLWDGNVRRTGADIGLDELAASIAAHWLLNPLTVRKAPKGRFAVVAGQRRYLAVRRLIEAGTLVKTDPVSCSVREGNDSAELSLAENVVRVAMHPADQFEAWRGLIDSGADVNGIAARFGVPESTVRKRLALARVSPRLFAAYRDGSMSLETLKAFTLTDDHAAQEAAWDSLSEWQRDDARAIRRALTETDVPSTDRRVLFVGLDVYEAAGGPVRRDLFDTAGGGFLQEAVLLDRLVRQKLDGIAADLASEGWAWTDARTEFGWEDQRAFLQAAREQADLPDAVRDEADALRAEYDALTDGDDEDCADRLRAIETRLDEIEKMALVWPDAVRAAAGAIVSLAYDGTVDIERGLIRREDVQDGRQDGGTPAAGAKEKAGADKLPSSLLEALTAHRTAALRIELARSPDMALVLVVHALASAAFYHAGSGVLKLSMAARSLRPSIPDHDACPAVIALNAERERVTALLPEDQAALWDWCVTALRDTLLDVLAVATAHGVDAVVRKTDTNDSGNRHGTALGQALGLDMTRWYRPTAAGYFGRIGKAAILADLEEARAARPAPAWLKLKKEELAALAERETTTRDWLPAPLR